jgi:GNAT superfamily N-acetyltransferase
MLDKSVPYVSFLMRRKKGAELPVYDLPGGYKFVLYNPGDEKSWAEIETSVSEFENETDALAYFEKEFQPLSELSELKKRCLFIENDKGEKIGTSTAWFCCPKKCMPRLHWVAVKPQYQGLGLGKAIVSKCTQLMKELDGDVDFFLSTQTWSHRAVKIYEKFGYAIAAEKQICGDKNENHEKAVEIMKSI